MNVIKQNKTEFRLQHDRRGVTIIEVLTSIIVAVIGVAGVLVMIPFGIRQAQTGLDLQDSTVLAENALHEFQIRSYGELGSYQGVEALPWLDLARIMVDDNADTNGDLNPDTEDQVELVTLTSDPFDPVGWFLIDPLWATAFTDPTAEPNNYPSSMMMEAMFNYVGSDATAPDRFYNGVLRSGGGGLYDIPPYFPRYIQLLDLTDPFLLRDPSDNTVEYDPPIANPVQLGFADRLFRSRDDIQFAIETDPVTGEEIQPFEPPVPYIDTYFDIGAGADLPMRRQFEGNISWSAIAVPKRNSGDVNLLDPLASGGAGHQIEGFDFYVLVYQGRSFENPTSFAADRDPRFIYTTLDTSAGPGLIYGVGTVTLDSGAVDIRNDEWVMLMNYDSNGESQVGFYRVIGTFENTITIDGSDFIITDDSGTMRETYAIYLPNVVNVFKRQLNMERN